MQKANSVGLSEEWKKKVRDGAISIKDVKDDTLKEQIESYQTWYEKQITVIHMKTKILHHLTQVKLQVVQLV